VNLGREHRDGQSTAHGVLHCTPRSSCGVACGSCFGQCIEFERVLSSAMCPSKGRCLKVASVASLGSPGWVAQSRR
jgi:hypothetical protein